MSSKLTNKTEIFSYFKNRENHLFCMFLGIRKTVKNKWIKPKSQSCPADHYGIQKFSIPPHMVVRMISKDCYYSIILSKRDNLDTKYVIWLLSIHCHWSANYGLLCIDSFKRANLANNFYHLVIVNTFTFVCFIVYYDHRW